MVFESLVTDLLNRFLGDYIENLDSKDLRVGIWRGDVVLKNLDIRRTALDNLDLPLKLKSGSLGTLTLKIPWRNLYREAVIVTIEGLYIVATPNLGIKYDAVKEEKQLQEAKQRELQRIEEQRKEKRKKAGPAKAQKQDTFAEKLVTQMIKNLQVTISDIHIRYEDEYTNPKRPFSMGATLHRLVFQTTDENWHPRVVKETVKTFFKIVDLDNLAVYWNSASYMLSPVSISARLVMNPKPEVYHFKAPKILLSVPIKELSFLIGKYQCQYILEFLEAQECLKLNAKYWKHRPNLRVYKKHEREWWRFAMDCILKEQVQRKARNWSLKHMKAHRELVRIYENAWVQKRTNTSPSKEALHTIEKAEKELDVFNLNVARQHAELYIDRAKLKRVEEQGRILNYVKGWWGWVSGGSKAAADEGDVAAKFEKAMTPEERGKLYEAIDYQKNQLPTTFPKDFVENKVSFTLGSLTVVVDNDLSERKKMEVMILSCESVSVGFEQRPSAKAVKLDAKMHKFQVEGIRGTDGEQPLIVSALDVREENEGPPQLLLQFETNPLSGAFDQLIKFYAQPLSVVYHAASVNALAEVFRPPESVRLKQLATAVVAKYEDIRERSATGLQYLLEKRTVLKLDIVILPTIVQIPDPGVTEKSSNVLVIDLGTLQISTEDVAKVKTDEAFYKKTEQEQLRLLRDSACDKFKVELKTLQMLFARPTDDWRAARKKKTTTKMHFLQPTELLILVEKAAVDDLRLPKLRILGHLPDLNFTASDTRLLDILKLLLSIPTPPPASETPASALEEEIEMAEPTTRDRAKMKAILEATGDKELSEEEEGEEEQRKYLAAQKKREKVQVEMAVVLKQIAVHITRTDADAVRRYLNLSVTSMRLTFKMRPLDMRAVASLGGVEVQYQTPGCDGPLYLLENPLKSSSSNIPLLRLNYIQADKKSPFFASEFRMVEKSVKITGQPLNITLHREALVDVQSFLQTLQKTLDDLKEASSSEGLEPPKQLDRQSSNMSTPSSTKSSQQRAAAAKALKRARTAAEVDERVINMKMEAYFSRLAVCITTSNRVLSDVRVEGLKTDVSIGPKTMGAEIRLKSIGITDPSPTSTYRKILSVVGEEVISLRYLQYVRSEKEKNKMGINDVDMEVALSFPEMRFVFLHLWLSQLLDWLTPFKGAAAAAADQARAAMQEGARNAVEVLKEIQHTAKIKFNVKIHAPVIIFPQCSKSTEAFWADFGNLVVENTFTSTPVGKGGPTSQALFDSIRVQLRKVKLSRVILGEDRWGVVAECQILEPVTFELDVIRNLSFSYFKENPEIKVTGKLPPLKVSCSREDYGVLMKTLSGNLAERAPATGAQVQPQKKEALAAASPAERGQKGSEQAKIEATVESTAPAEAGNKDKVKLLFEIESIIAQLYDGSSNLRAGIAQRDPTNALASIKINTILAKAVMKENGSMDAVVYLFSFTVDDSRADRTGITRLMEKKGGNAANKQNMIDIWYKKDALSNQEAELRLRPFFLFVCPEFLGALSRFFVVSKTEEELALEEQNRQRLEETSAHDQKKLMPQQTAGEGEVAPGSMRVWVFIEDPEVILVEDAADPGDTQAIILTFHAELFVDSQPEATQMSGDVFGLEITSCDFDMSKRDTNCLKVLTSCAITLRANKPKGLGQHYSLEFTPVKIRISPTVIRLLSAVVVNMAVVRESSAREKERTLIARQHVWNHKSIAECDIGFLNDVLKAEEGVGFERLFTPVEDLAEESDDRKEDQCHLVIDEIELTLEADSGAGTEPMIRLTSDFRADVREWSKQLRAEAALSLELWYYNENFYVWEPLLEPVIEKDGTRRPWKLEAFINEYEEADMEIVQQLPKRLVHLQAADGLQLTVTKTLLDLTSELGDAFARAAKQIEPKEATGAVIPFSWCIRNATGVEVEVMDSKSFSLDPEQRGILPLGGIFPLQCKVQRQHIGAEDDKAKMVLTLRFPNTDEYRDVNIARAEKRVFAMEMEKPTCPGEKWHVVVDTTSQYDNKLVTIRSLIKFVNRLPIDVDILYPESLPEFARTVEANGGEHSLELDAMYAQTGELWVQPRGYEIGRQTIKWREINAGWLALIECLPEGGQGMSYCVQASAEIDDAFLENTYRSTDATCYVIYLSAPTLFRNALPYTLEISATGMETQVLKGGESASLCSIVPGTSIGLKVLYADVIWSCELKIEKDFEELTQHTFRSSRVRPGPNEIDLGLRTTRRCGTEEMTLYCPFWMINKTGKHLMYKTGNLAKVFEHLPDSDKALLFTFSGVAFFAKNKKVCLKVEDSSWSDKFPLDVAGSAGRVTCKARGDKKFEVSVNIQLSHSGLTKIVAFTPFYLVDNRTKADVEVRQSAIGGVESWTRIPRKECLGFWPEKKKKPMQMSVRYADTRDPERAESQPFPMTRSFESFVMMPNEFVGVYVTSHVSDNAVVMTLEQYENGMAPVWLINATDDVKISYWQKDMKGDSQSLSPGYCVLYSWTSVMRDRILAWASDRKRPTLNDLVKDGMGEVRTMKHGKVYWVSFLSGRQRILLFTQDVATATTALKPYELERSDLQYTLELPSVDVSLINNLVGREIASMAFTSSGVVWEHKKGAQAASRRRFKAFSAKDNECLEEAYVKYIDDKNEGKKPKSRVLVGTKLEVDFEEMKWYELREAKAKIRRSFQSALRVQYTQSPHEQRFYVKVNHFQLDSQLPECIFPTVLTRVPPTKSVVADNIPKPFVEISFVRRKAEHSNIPRIKYFVVLVQEVSVQVDKGFINAIIEMCASQSAVTYGMEEYEKDLEITRQTLAQLAAITSSAEQKAYYEYLYFSPMKIRLSFSRGGVSDEDSGKATPIHSEVFNLLLKSVGATLTDFQDVEFRLAYLEQKGVFMNRQQLIDEAVSHYAKQAIRQVYALVLGLDIMGNPVGLMRGLSSDVEKLFYEPIEGAIQGPEELAEGLAFGVRGFCCGAVGGAAGAVSRITGTLGKALAALTLDKEYQKKRQQMLSRRPASAREGFARGAKELAMGFVEGFRGLYSKPIQGAKKGGAGGFAKGVGKGVVGLVTRPISGMFDFASSSLQAVKRATDTVEGVKKLRPARFIEPDRIVRLFSLKDAEGNQLLKRDR